MTMSDRDQGARHERASRWAWWFFAAVALFYLLTEHRAHLFGALPWLLLLACPLLHFFMHGRHGKHHGHAAHDREKQP